MVREELVMFLYKKCIRALGRRQTIILKKNEFGRLEAVMPFHAEFSKSKVHGKMWYKKSDVNNADFIIKIRISNSGKHNCKIIKWNADLLNELEGWLDTHEHICVNLYNQMRMIELSKEWKEEADKRAKEGVS